MDHYWLPIQRFYCFGEFLCGESNARRGVWVQHDRDRFRARTKSDQDYKSRKRNGELFNCGAGLHIFEYMDRGADVKSKLKIQFNLFASKFFQLIRSRGEKRWRATALQDADARIQAKVGLKVFHRQFRCADFAVNNLRLQDGKQ
jgi:hypothetical protein